MFGSGSAPAFGTPSTAPMFGYTTPLFGGSSSSSSAATPFGATSTPSLFGSSASQSGAATFGSTASAFGQSTPFGQAQPSLFGQSTPQQPSPSPFGQPAFGQTQASLFGQSTTSQQQSPSPFGQPAPPLAFGQTQLSLFGQSSSQPQQQQPSVSPFGQSIPTFGQPPPTFGQAQTPVFGQPQSSAFGNLSQPPPFNSSQLVTQMAPVAPLAFSLPDRDIQAILDAYKDEPGNPKYGFKHLLLSVTDPSMRIKPVGVSDIMWAEAMNKLEGMDSADRERLWPELVQGFKDLSHRLKLQDEAIAADAQRLQATQMNVKLLERHFLVDTMPWIQRMRQKEQDLQRRLLRTTRIVESLEGRGFRMPPTKGEAHLGEKLSTLARQLQGSGAELPRRVHTLLSISRMRAQIGGAPTVLPGLAKIDDRSLGEMHEVLHQQTEAISRLGNVLKRDMRNVEIIMSEDTEMSDRSIESDLGRTPLNRILPSYNSNGLNGPQRRFL